MEIKIIKTNLKEIQPFRILFLQENNFQFIHNKCHLYGWADTYIIIMDDIKIGYGSVWGREKREDRDAIFEFYVIMPYRKFANPCFEKLISVSGTPFMECQTNDLLLSSMFFEYSQNVVAEAILFKDYFQTDFKIDGLNLNKKLAEGNDRKDDCEYVLKLDDEIIATGGLMLNYNMPYADLYYDVNESYRQRGFGSFMVQELKKVAYLMGRLPAARCNIKNKISKATLLNAGFVVCGYLLNGEITNSPASLK